MLDIDRKWTLTILKGAVALAQSYGAQRVRNVLGRRRDIPDISDEDGSGEGLLWDIPDDCPVLTHNPDVASARFQHGRSVDIESGSGNGRDRCN